jgi:homoserine dehydrogenase
VAADASDTISGAMSSAGPHAVAPGTTTMPLRVAVLGAGTVGREVIRALVDPDDARRVRVGPGGGGRALALTGVAVRDLDRARGSGIPEELLTDAPAHLVATADSDVIVELMGGDEPARTLLLAALRAGKDAVTANKHVLAHHGPEIEDAAAGTGASIRFEAAVGGGIPVLAALAGGLAADRLERVRGIVNGTTNHILSAMERGAGTYEAVLRDAQQRGYAEADPSGDVEGRDAINKLVVLVRLAFGRWLDPASIPDRPPSVRGWGGPGITGVTADQLAGARALGLTIRLLASASRSGERISASVLPTAVPETSALGRTSGVRNRIEVRSDPIGDVGFDGPGAGGPATSSAVLADLLALARGEGSTWAGTPAGTVTGSGPRPGDADRRRGEQAAHRWFLLLPGVRKPARMREIIDASAVVPGGLAIRTPWLGLDTLRARIQAATHGALDTPCYPLADD